MTPPLTPWDAVMKEVLTHLFGQAGATVTTEYEVGRLPRTIDGVAVCDDAARAWLAQETPLDFLGSHALLEGKSERDYLSAEEFKLITARAYLYLAQAALDDLSQLTVCVISAGFPRKVLQQSPQLVRFRPVRRALWQAEMELPFYVLVCSELEVTPRNYPFLLFASGRKRRAFLQALVQESGSPYLPLALELYPQTVVEEFLMSRKSTKREKELRNAINLIGPETIVRLLPPESLLEAIQSQSPEQRAQLVEGFLDRLDLQEVEAWLQTKRVQPQG